jgi:hypothetical protein
MRHISGGNGVYLMVSGLLENPMRVGNQGCKGGRNTKWSPISII